jgi:NADPH:quinone reductase-like Zn-dependent oxidoreductase
MRFLTHDRFGTPSKVLRLVERPDLVPSGHDVVIAVEATPIHAGDIKNIAGEKTMVRNVDTGTVREIAALDDASVELPQTPGIEGVGRIVAVGPLVEAFSIGARVFLPFQCGSWSEQVCADSRRLIPAPEGDAVQLSLIVNAFTADLALRDLAPLRAGDWFVQNSANSNVGRILIALAKRRGIRTLNIVRRAEVADELYALGATAVVVEGPDLAARVTAASGGAPLMIGLDGIAGAATGALAECLSNGATVANFGLMSGEPCTIAPWILHYKRTILRGYYAGHNLFERGIDEQRAILADLAELIAQGELKARICATYPFSDYAAAVGHAARAGGERDGKIVFVADGS